MVGCKRKFRFVLAFFVLLNTATKVESKPAPVESVAILGDSISTASVTAEELEWDLISLTNLVSAQKRIQPKLDRYSKSFSEIIAEPGEEGVPQPVRFWETAEEYPGLSWADRNKKRAEIFLKASYLGSYIDILPYSWGFMVGRALGVPARKIYFAAEEGHRPEHTLKQVQRLLKGTQSVLPDHIYIFFTGMDICSIDPLTPNLEQLRKDAAAGLMKGLAELLKNGKVSAGKEIHVFVPSHMDIAQLIDNPVVQKKTVYAFGKNRTCSEFRQYNPQGNDATSQVKDPGLKGLLKALKLENIPPVAKMCPSVLGTFEGAPDYAQRVQWFRKATEAAQQAASDAVTQANQLQQKDYREKNIRFHVLESTKTFPIREEHVAKDCFHLSIPGQEELARLVLGELRDKNIANVKRF